MRIIAFAAAEGDSERDHRIAARILGDVDLANRQSHQCRRQ